MKKYQNLILPICLLLLFATCKKDMRLQRTGPDGTYARSVTPTNGYEWKFDTTNNFEGWTYGNVTATVSGGSLNMTTVSPSADPLLISPDNLGISVPANHKYIRINMKNNSTVTSARIFFTTTTDTSWSQAKSKSFAITTNNSYAVSYIVDMSTVAGWAGTIRRIRVDPLDPAGTTGGQTVNIDYIGITEPATVTNIKEWYFDSPGNIEGWTPGDVSYTVSGGTLNVTATSTDPRLISPDNLGITNPATYKFVHVDMKNNSADTSLRIFFITDADTAWNSTKSKRFTIQPNTSYYGSYIVDMSTVAGWTGTIRRIRVDPLDPSANGHTVNIDFIRVTDNQSLRGVMSPQYFRGGAAHPTGFSAGAADTLKNIWKANVMRWQINDPNAATTDYDTFISNEMTELDNAFALCEPLGIKILIDLHYPPGGGNSSTTNLFYNQTYNDKIVSVWQTLATHYKDRVGLFGYDLINEPLQETATTPTLDFKYTETRIGNAIRAIDLKTPIFISLSPGDNPSNFSGFTPVPLTNVVYEVHMYEPHEYTQQHIDTTTPFYTYPGNILHNGNSVYYDKTQLTNVLNPVRVFQTNYNARIFVGEFSAARWAGGAATYLRDCMEIFEGYGWSWTYHAYIESNIFDLDYNNLPASPHGATRDTVGHTDRYDQVVGWGLNQNH